MVIAVEWGSLVDEGINVAQDNPLFEFCKPTCTQQQLCKISLLVSVDRFRHIVYFVPRNLSLDLWRDKICISFISVSGTVACETRRG